MVQRLHPGVYVEEIRSAVQGIVPAPTAVTAFVGYTGQGDVNSPVTLYSWAEFERRFGPLHSASPVGYGVQQFFANGGTEAVVVRVTDDLGGPGTTLDLIGSREEKTGLHALIEHDFNLLVIPETFNLHDGEEAAVVAAGIALCEAQQAFYIVDAPAHCTLQTITAWAHGISRSCNGATYFPPVCLLDPLADLQPRAAAPSGAMAGIFARTDVQRGVWKAPAGAEATLRGVVGLALELNDIESGQINPQAVNVLRRFAPHGLMPWGARTLRGSDALADEYKYIPVRRLALLIERSVARGTRWAALESNAEPLWARLRQVVGEFMLALFHQGAFEGKTPAEGFFVQCDSATTTAEDRQNGRVTLLIGFAPLRPAEFVYLRMPVQAAHPS